MAKKMQLFENKKSVARETIIITLFYKKIFGFFRLDYCTNINHTNYGGVHELQQWML